MDTERELVELRRRVDALEAASVAPAFSALAGLQVAADGRTSYDFEGHISAEGVDLPASTTAEGSEESAVQWTAADGAIAGTVDALYDGDYHLRVRGPFNGTAIELTSDTIEIRDGATQRVLTASGGVLSSWIKHRSTGDLALDWDYSTGQLQVYVDGVLVLVI